MTNWDAEGGDVNTLWQGDANHGQSRTPGIQHKNTSLRSGKRVVDAFFDSTRDVEGT
jgi:hypothetical protein